MVIRIVGLLFRTVVNTVSINSLFHHSRLHHHHSDICKNPKTDKHVCILNRIPDVMNANLHVIVCYCYDSIKLLINIDVIEFDPTTSVGDGML